MNNDLTSCEWCGKLTKNKRFCSREHYGLWQRKQSTKNNPIDRLLVDTQYILQSEKLPRGTFTRIAEELGVSRQRVHQRAERLDIEIEYKGD